MQPGTHSLSLSSSSDDFKPLSVDHAKPGRLKVGEGDEVNVSLPVVQVGARNCRHTIHASGTIWYVMKQSSIILSRT